MGLPRRKFLHFAGAAAATPALLQLASAQTSYPGRPITMIVAFAPGAITDVAGRLLAERMRGPLEQPIIIENAGGADGTIGTGRAARAKPDGYTIDFGSSGSHVLNGALYPSLQYDVLDDFAPISPVGVTSAVLFARKGLPAKDLPEFVAWLKDNPNKASAGILSGANHLVTAFFQKQIAAQFALVPYRGGSLAMRDLIAGQIDFAFVTPDQLPLLRAGKVKAYAVTGRARLALAPDIPTVGEMGLPAVSYTAWWGLFAPKGTPKDIIGKLNAAVVEALADRTLRSRLADLGMEIFPRDQQRPEALGVLVKADAEKWWPIIKELRIKAE